jgi:hypothetical protein
VFSTKLLGCCKCIFSIVLLHEAYTARPQPPGTFVWLSVFRLEANDRSCDQVMLIPKIAAEDTTLTVGNVDGVMTTVPVPSGMQIDIHVAGLHYNRTLSGFVSWGQVLRKAL